MATLREIKRRIKSINSTAKVTHAMELVAAAKMRKSQEAALTSRPYNTTLSQVIRYLKPETHEKRHILLTKGQGDKQLVILLTSDRGLVGGLNLNLIRLITQSEYKNIKYVVVGKKGSNFAAKTGQNILASFGSDEQPLLDLARSLTKLVVDAFKAGEAQNVFIVYPDFQSTIKQVPTISKLLPISLEEIEKLPTTNNQIPTELLFEPSPDYILEKILPHHILTRIYQALLEAKASEHSARMVAMKNATDAANDLVDDLTLTYNQARQEAITNELLDIITAQAAFK